MKSIETNIQRLNELIEEGEQLTQKIAEFKESKAKNERETTELSETIRRKLCEELIFNGGGTITDTMIKEKNQKYPNPNSKFLLTMDFVAEQMTELKKQGKIEAEAFVCHKSRLLAADSLLKVHPRDQLKEWTSDIKYWADYNHVVFSFRNIKIVK